MELRIGVHAAIPAQISGDLFRHLQPGLRTIRARRLGETLTLALAFSAIGACQEYSFRVYGAAEGLQNLVVLSLAQDRVGYIWAGTEGGLYRYDGASFRLMGPAEGLPCSNEA